MIKGYQRILQREGEVVTKTGQISFLILDLQPLSEVEFSQLKPQLQQGEKKKW